MSNEQYQILTGHQSDVNWVDFSGHRKLVSCSNDRTIRLWEYVDIDDNIDGGNTGQQKNDLHNDRHDIGENNNNNGGSSTSGVDGGSGLFKKSKLSKLTGHKYGVNCVRYSPFGTIIASASTDGYIILWNSQNGEQVLKMMHDSKSAIRVCCFSPSSALLTSGADDETLVVWDISTRRKIKTLDKHTARITACSFTPDSSYLISCSSGGDLKLWDTKHGNINYLMTYEAAHDLGVLGCDFSSQYEVNVAEGPLQSYYLLATCGNDDLVKLWHINAGPNHHITLSHKLIGHEANVNCCQFSMDGTLLASAGGDKLVIVWDPRSGQMLHRLEGHKRYVTSCAFSDNNQFLASGSNDQTIIVWHLDKIKEKVINIQSHNKSLIVSNKIDGDSNRLRQQQQRRKTKGTISLENDNNKSNLFWQKIPSEWDCNDVCDWISSASSIGLGQYKDIFKSHKIDGEELLHLTHDTLLVNLKIEPLGHRNKILRSILCLKNPLWQHTMDQNGPEKFLKPNEFCCPITKEIMNDPVIAADGHSYERDAMQKWINDGNSTSPMTNEILSTQTLIPNLNLRSLIQKFQSALSTREIIDD